MAILEVKFANAPHIIIITVTTTLALAMFTILLGTLLYLLNAIMKLR
jgi:hypothetical protein